MYLIVLVADLTVGFW